MYYVHEINLFDLSTSSWFMDGKRVNHWLRIKRVKPMPNWSKRERSHVRLIWDTLVCWKVKKHVKHFKTWMYCDHEINFLDFYFIFWDVFVCWKVKQHVKKLKTWMNYGHNCFLTFNLSFEMSFYVGKLKTHVLCSWNKLVWLEYFLMIHGW